MSKISITVFAVLLSLLVLNVYADQVKQAQEAGKEKEMALLDLFDSKCTKCHDAKTSQILHEIESGVPYYHSFCCNYNKFIFINNTH